MIIKLYGVATAEEVPINISFVPNDTVAFSPVTKTYIARIFRWQSHGANSSHQCPSETCGENGDQCCDWNRCTASVNSTPGSHLAFDTYHYYYNGKLSPNSYTTTRGKLGGTCWGAYLD